MAAANRSSCVAAAGVGCDSFVENAFGMVTSLCMALTSFRRALRNTKGHSGGAHRVAGVCDC